MLNFRRSLWQTVRIQTALRQSDFMGCEYSFANNLAWCRGADSASVPLRVLSDHIAFDTPDGTPHFRSPAERAT